MSAKVSAVTAPVNLGEGPHWSVKEQALYYVDIFSQNLHRYHPASQTHSTLHIEGGPVTLVVPHASHPKTFVVSVGQTLSAVTWPDLTRDHSTSTLTTLATVEAHLPKNRFNDGKCDDLGRLWAGTMGATDVPGNPSPFQGNLYTLGTSGASRVLDKVSISNGLAWSEDNSTFYYVDTCEYKVEAFKCDFTKAYISDRRTIFDYRQAGLYPAFPDGMTIDTQGRLWVACFGAAKIHCIEPRSGRIESSVDLPTSNPTSVCWGGPGMDELFITTTKKNLNESQLKAQPQAGAVFRVTGLGASGKPPKDCTITLPTSA